MNINCPKCRNSGKWQISPANLLGGVWIPANASCTNCWSSNHFTIELSSLLQFDSLEQLKSWKTKLPNWIAIGISIIALIVSFIVGYLPYKETIKNIEIRKNCSKIAPSTIGENTDKNYKACIRNNGLE